MVIDSSGQFQSAQAGERPLVSPEEEIKELERRLEQKKRELAAGAVAPAERAPAEHPMPEKEMLRDVLREHIAEHQPASVSAPHAPGLVPQLSPTLSDNGAKKTDDDGKSNRRDEELKALVDFALSRGISGAIEKARAESPYLLDALHDRLTDEYYEKMVALGKIKPL